MKNIISDLFKLDKKPKHGLLPVEWVVLAYIVFTSILIFIYYSKLVNPQAMVSGRFHVLAMSLALWLVYRLLPCRFTFVARIIAQMALLAFWYPETYELNRIFPNLDHYFAIWEQTLFGVQPALVFATTFSSKIVSELMSMGYAAFYPMILLTALYYLFCHTKQFQQCTFVIVASFFAYYAIYDLLPVVGPTFYYKAVGLENVTKGFFPNVGDYFNTHRACLTTPGFHDGFFYHLVEDAKAAGERPTAAFPSSHVGIATICMLLFWHVRNWKMIGILFPFYFFLCLATVYIQAHYVIDAIAGLITGILFYSVFLYTSRNFKG